MYEGVIQNLSSLREVAPSLKRRVRHDKAISFIVQGIASLPWSRYRLRKERSALLDQRSLAMTFAYF